MAVDVVVAVHGEDEDYREEDDEGGEENTEID